MANKSSISQNQVLTLTDHDWGSMLRRHFPDEYATLPAIPHLTHQTEYRKQFNKASQAHYHMLNQTQRDFFSFIKQGNVSHTTLIAFMKQHFADFQERDFANYFNALITTTDYRGLNSLHWTARNGDRQTLATLVETIAQCNSPLDIDALDNWKTGGYYTKQEYEQHTALCWASTEHVASYLIKHGASLHPSGLYPLTLAARHGRLHVVKLLLNHMPSNATMRDETIIAAVIGGNEKVLLMLLQHRPELRLEAFVQACAHGHINIVSMLWKQLQQGLLDSEKSQYQHALRMGIEQAVLHDHLITVEYLTYRTKMDKRQLERCVVAAANTGNPMILQLIFDKCEHSADDNLDYCVLSEETYDQALDRAIYSGNDDCIQHILAKARIHTGNIEQHLANAAYTNNPKLIEALLQRFPNTSSKVLSTALSAGALQQHLEACQRLLNHKACIDTGLLARIISDNPYFKIPHDPFYILKLLLENGADPNANDHYLGSPLQQALYYYKVRDPIPLLLLEYGATPLNTTAENDKWQQAYHHIFLARRALRKQLASEVVNQLKQVNPEVLHHYLHQLQKDLQYRPCLESERLALLTAIETMLRKDSHELHR